jgi:hypothetical protein
MYYRTFRCTATQLVRVHRTMVKPDHAASAYLYCWRSPESVEIWTARSRVNIIPRAARWVEGGAGGEAGYAEGGAGRDETTPVAAGVRVAFRRPVRGEATPST